MNERICIECGKRYHNSPAMFEHQLSHKDNNATREDAKPVASASDDSREVFAKWWEREKGNHCAHNYSPMRTAWQACEAQHQQKVRELTAYLGQCASWDSADLAQIINSKLGE